MSNNQEIAQFISVTGASPAAAVFYLDSAQGDVESAVDAFFAADGAAPQVQPGAAASDEPPLGRRPPPQSAPAPEPVQAPAASRARRTLPAGAGKIRSLADLNREEDKSDDDDTNEYYAGGEKSGQVVRGRDDKKERVENLFERARQSGAESGTAADLEAQAAQARSFKGRARTLGSGGDAAATKAPEPTPAAADPSQPLVHTITFWANNVFTVNDGEPRDMFDPANKAFLDAISNGECPHELLPEHSGTAINVNMVRKDMDYEPAAQPRHVAFTGKGRTLTGDGASSSASVPSSSQAATAAPDLSIAWAGVDPSQPATSIQLRLADGSRMVAQFNHSHTVADIRRFIAASRPDLPAAYNLMTAFPSAQLTDDSKTISDAGLLNAVIIQKM